MPKENNWWGPAGMTGPCGPDTEMFIDTGKEKCCPECNPSCSCGKYVEIWNNVFMQFNKEADGSFTELAQKNVDTGMGLERLACVMQGVNNLFEVDTVQNVMKHISDIAGIPYKQDEKTSF